MGWISYALAKYELIKKYTIVHRYGCKINMF